MKFVSLQITYQIIRTIYKDKNIIHFKKCLMEQKKSYQYIGSLGVNGFLKLGETYTGTFRKVKKEKLVFFGNEEKVLMMNPHAALPKKLKRRLRDGDEIQVKISFIFCSGGMNAELV